MNYLFEILEKLKKHNYKTLKEFDDIEELYIFIQPNYPEYNKNIWDECANILYKKSDEELVPYLIPLFEWLQDLTWPGSQRIFERLSKINNNELNNCLMYSLIKANFYKDNIWKNNLLEFAKENAINTIFDESRKNIFED